MDNEDRVTSNETSRVVVSQLPHDLHIPSVTRLTDEQRQAFQDFHRLCDHDGLLSEPIDSLDESWGADLVDQGSLLQVSPARLCYSSEKSSLIPAVEDTCAPASTTSMMPTDILRNRVAFAASTASAIFNQVWMLTYTGKQRCW